MTAMAAGSTDDPRALLEGARGVGVRRKLAAAVAVLALVVVLAAAPTPAPIEQDPRPNILVILTDDQTLDTLPSEPAAMPWFQSQLQDPTGHWLWFPNAVVTTPLCAPSRSTILTGRYDTQTGVRNNAEAPNLDDANTLPVWLHDAGYRTGLVGKYLNVYPWGRAPFIPPGWDRWFAKENANESTAYYDYDVVDQGIVRHYGAAPQNYATDVLGPQAVRFVQDAPAGQPWFLYFAPNAPHQPWVPAPRYSGTFDGVSPPIAPLDVLNDVTGKPLYVSSLPPLTEAGRQAFIQDDRNERAMLLSVDDWFHAIVDAVDARGELENTVIIFLTDNGYTFGLHRLDGKRYPYTPSIGVPFAIRTPWAQAGTVDNLVSNLDLAGTITGLAEATPGLLQDGIDLGPALRGEPLPHRRGVFLDWAGDDTTVTPWQGIRTARYLYVRYSDGFEELYLTSDTDQLHNLVSDATYGPMLRAARSLLRASSSEAQG
jgi:N-acetylglucosamine-6-sulfatase